MRILIFLFLSVLLMSCSEPAKDEPAAVTAEVASPPETIGLNTEPSSNYEQAHELAVKAIQTSADKGHAWNTADRLLANAEKAAADGDDALAISLADEARMQADLASTQADAEAATWHQNVITD